MPRRLANRRLRLRPLDKADAVAVFAFAGDPAVTRFLDWPTHADLDDSRALIDDTLWGWRAGDDFCWAIDYAGVVVGTVGCQFDEHGAQFGYVLARGAWGQGLATEAVQPVLAAARDIQSVHRFWATCDPENQASARVLEKLGMTREGRLARWSERPNHEAAHGPRDVWVYAWTR